jgi:uncharacterized Zn finger protein
MIELKNREQLQNAIERARADRKSLFVQLTDVARQYRVTNRRNGNTYVVSFLVNENGKRRLGQCSCKAGARGHVCKHLAAAAGLNTCLAEQGLLNRQTASLQ